MGTYDTVGGTPRHDPAADFEASVYDEIVAECAYQDKKWGHATDDTANTPWMWAAYIAQYATKWQAGTFAPLTTEVVDDFRAKMVKVAALAIGAVESVDRQREANGRAFYEAEPE